MNKSLMTPEIIDCVQGEEEWHIARLGIPTASRFGTVMAVGKGGGESLTRRKYMLELAGERLTNRPTESYTNAHMERGKEQEPQALAEYSFQNDAEVQRVGFIRCGRTGCSPDGLIGEDGMVEAKSALPHILIDIHLRKRYPPEHRQQCQGNLWVAQRKWIDIIVFCPGIPSYKERVFRDEAYIMEIAGAVGTFNRELDVIVKYVALIDNRWENLREATHAQNGANRGANKNSLTGIKGVSVYGGRYRATIQANRQWKQIGIYDTLDEAKDAYALAAERIHGEFARTS